MRDTLTAIVTAGAIILTTAGQAAAMGPSQKSWSDYNIHNQRHNAGRSPKNRHHRAREQHPKWTDNYAETRGPIGDYDRLPVWHYGDGGFDRHSTGLTTDELTNQSPKARKASLELEVGSET
jgi:hypothetical protein